jgi:hypothetical protein
MYAYGENGHVYVTDGNRFGLAVECHNPMDCRVEMEASTADLPSVVYVTDGDRSWSWTVAECREPGDCALPVSPPSPSQR